MPNKTKPLSGKYKSSRSPSTEQEWKRPHVFAPDAVAYITPPARWKEMLLSEWKPCLSVTTSCCREVTREEKKAGRIEWRARAPGFDVKLSKSDRRYGRSCICDVAVHIRRHVPRFRILFRAPFRSLFFFSLSSPLPFWPFPSCVACLFLGAAWSKWLVFLCRKIALPTYSSTRAPRDLPVGFRQGKKCPSVSHEKWDFTNLFCELNSLHDHNVCVTKSTFDKQNKLICRA